MFTVFNTGSLAKYNTQQGPWFVSIAGSLQVIWQKFHSNSMADLAILLVGQQFLV